MLPGTPTTTAGIDLDAEVTDETLWATAIEWPEARLSPGPLLMAGSRGPLIAVSDGIVALDGTDGSVLRT